MAGGQPLAPLAGWQNRFLGRMRQSNTRRDESENVPEQAVFQSEIAEAIPP
jgi:hypothetical protein